MYCSGSAGDLLGDGGAVQEAQVDDVDHGRRQVVVGGTRLEQGGDLQKPSSREVKLSVSTWGQLHPAWGLPPAGELASSMQPAHCGLPAGEPECQPG